MDSVGSKRLLRELFLERIRGSVDIAGGARATLLVDILYGDNVHGFYVYSARHASTGTKTWQTLGLQVGAGDQPVETDIDCALRSLRSNDADGNNQTEIDLCINNRTGVTRTVDYVVYRIAGLA